MKISEFKHLEKTFPFYLGMKTKTNLKYSHVGKDKSLNQWMIALVKELTNGKITLWIIKLY